jgi:hypothetical protein
MRKGMHGPLATVMAVVMGACGVATDPSVVTPSAGRGPSAGDGSAQAASPPIGAFRTTPAADQGVITVGAGNPVTVNGARFTPGEPGDELKLEIEWGDGTHDSIGCGPCRLSHVYTGTGAFPMVARIHNRRSVDRGEVTQAFRVVVQSPDDPSQGPPLFCQPIHAHIGVFGSPTVVACPSGATQFCDTVPIVATSSAQAQQACNTCLGGQCNSANGNTFGEAWYFDRPSPSVTSRSFFTYNPTPNYPSITAGAISDVLVATGRWAP